MFTGIQGIISNTFLRVVQLFVSLLFENFRALSFCLLGGSPHILPLYKAAPFYRINKILFLPTKNCFIGSICLLLRWGAMDAEAYPEASKNVLHILWGIGTSVHPGHDLKWAKARTSAFVALIQYEVIL